MLQHKCLPAKISIDNAENGLNIARKESSFSIRTSIFEPTEFFAGHRAIARAQTRGRAPRVGEAASQRRATGEAAQGPGQAYADLKRSKILFQFVK